MATQYSFELMTGSLSKNMVPRGFWGEKMNILHSISIGTIFMKSQN